MKLVAPAIFSLLSWAAHADTIAGRASVIDGDTREIHGDEHWLNELNRSDKEQWLVEAVHIPLA